MPPADTNGSRATAEAEPSVADGAAANEAEERRDVGAALPIFLDPFALEIPRWKDPVSDLNARAYEIIRTTDVTANPMEKFAMRVGTYQFKVEGPDGERKEALQFILDQMPKLPDTHRGLVWAYAEGVRFGWIRLHDFTDGYAIPAVSVRRKVAAGGTFLWNGESHSERRVVKRRQFQAYSGRQEDVEAAQAEELDTSRVIVFVTGNTGSPEGDLDTAWRLFNLADQGQHLDRTSWKYTDRFGMPWDILRANLGKATPAAARAKLDDLSEKQSALNQRRSSLTLDGASLLEIMEPSGESWRHVESKQRLLEMRAEMMILKNVLTSRTTDAGAAGSSQVHKLEEDFVVGYAAADLAEAYAPLLGWIETRNEAVLPPENAGEHYLTLVPPPEQAERTVDEVIRLKQSGFRLDTAWAYQVLNAPVPEGTPDVIEQETPLGFGFDFLSRRSTNRPANANDDGNDDGEDEDDEPLDDDEKAKRARHGRIKSAIKDGEQVELAEDLVGRLKAIFDASLVAILDGTFAGSDQAKAMAALIVEALQLGHLEGSEALLAELAALIGVARSFAKREGDDQAELDRLAAIYEAHAEEVSTIIPDRLRKRMQRRVSDFIAAGGNPGDTQAFVAWLTSQDPNITEGYARLVLRNATAEAYSAGRLEKYRAVAEPIGLNRKISDAGDSSVREEHHRYNGIVLPPGVEFDKYTPPYDHNCRCVWTLTLDEASPLEVIHALPILPFNR